VLRRPLTSGARALRFAWCALLVACGSTLRRVDAAARQVGEPIEIARLSGSRHAAAVAFSGRDFGIVYGSPSAEEWTYSLRRADCADPGGPAP
jgi:hypothetical protein